MKWSIEYFNGVAVGGGFLRISNIYAVNSNKKKRSLVILNELYICRNLACTSWIVYLSGLQNFNVKWENTQIKIRQVVRWIFWLFRIKLCWFAWVRLRSVFVKHIWDYHKFISVNEAIVIFRQRKNWSWRQFWKQIN